MLSAYKTIIIVLLIMFVSVLLFEIYVFLKIKKIKKKCELEFDEQKKIYEELVDCIANNKSSLDRRDTDYKYIMHDEAEIRKYLTNNNQNAIEYLLEEKTKYANDCGIDFFVSGFDKSPFFNKFNQIDVLRLWANLINNAIRGAGKGGFVRVEFENLFKEKNIFFVRVRNNKSACKDIKEGISDKNDDGNTHGYGIKIVKEIVDSFAGDIEWIDKGNEVCVNMEFIVIKE